MKKRKIKLASDIDDTIVDFYADFAKFSLKYYGKKILPNASFIEFWNLFETKSKTIDVIKKYESLNRTYSLKIFEDFKEVFLSLKEKYSFSFLITARDFDKKEKTIEFFKKAFDCFDLKIHYTRDYKPRKKSFICKELGVLRIVEDSPLNALDCAENGIEVFLLDKFWNKEIKHKNIIRVKNWYDILNY